MTPKEAATKLYQSSRRSLMAHSLRAVKGQFILNGVDLDIYIRTDRRAGMPEARKGPHSLLHRRWQPAEKREDEAGQARRSGRVKSLIWIHPEASWHLARFCIAHEIYHLLPPVDGT